MRDARFDGSGPYAARCVDGATRASIRLPLLRSGAVATSADAIVTRPQPSRFGHERRGRSARTRECAGGEMMRGGEGWMAAAMLLIATSVSAQTGPPSLPVVPGHTCTPVTQAHADASAGTANVNHDGSPLPGIPAPDISRGFQGIPRSAQPPLTASQKRILECTYHLAEANADMPVHAVRAVQLCAWNAVAADRGSPWVEHHAAHADPLRRHH